MVGEMGLSEPGDLSKLSDGEKKAVAKLIEAGQIFQKLYEEQRHPEALSAYRALEQLDKRTGSTPATQNLLTLYRLFQGPIATTLENKREPFLPVDGTKPGKNVYPWGISVNVVEPQAIDRTRVLFRTFVWDESKLGQGAGSGLDRVEAEDEAIVEAVARGVRSRLYGRGRYSPTRERGVHHFHRLLCEFLQ
jgi:hypothetical protein